ncbi:hypothetical protein SAMN05216215_101545 [Saccharopolyspora shandongensis]|uniref:Ferredoxin n=1 Tax=Saccharopolyspora shandongensis TaxID=418495 RepID=A0A1H3EK44_9PSEU|nr:hypothetical protein [Saccharopolyspora shandongensis]SDX78965.1 hypothetical protein SAMN05216215_101545 [Saccharopolyspora shandongensis]
MTWAKAPDLADRPAALARVRESTAADRDDYLRSGLCPVACGRCGVRVLAKKNSPQHTSIQWTAEGARRCATFAGRPAGEVAESCADVLASIDAAARDGLIETPPHDPDGDPRSL